MRKITTKIPQPKVPVPQKPKMNLPRIKRIAGVQSPYRINKLR